MTPAIPSPAPFVLAPDFVLRVAGLPLSALGPLRARDTEAWLRHALTLEDEAAAIAPEAEDALAEAVAQAGRAAVRRELLALRRDIHNARTPRTERATGPVPPSVTRWLSVRSRYEDALAAAERALATELATARSWLHTLARDPVLRAGIQAASPSLDAALPAYLASEATTPGDKRRRKAERALVSYVYRAALKTSPFSTFTSLSRGRFTESGEALRLGPPPKGQDVRPLLRARPNLTAVHEIARAALEDPATRAALPFRAVGGRRKAGGRLHYTRRRYREVDPGIALAAPGILYEEPFRLPAGPVLEEALELLEIAPGDGLTLPELVDALHRADPDRRPRDQLFRYLDRLVECGLLVTPALALDVHHPDPVAALASRLRELHGPTGAPALLAEDLDRLGALAHAHPLTPPEERSRRTAALRAATADTQRRLGRAEPVVPRTAVYEDAVLAGSGIAGRAAWEDGPLPALRRFARLLPAFDLLLGDRLLARAHFRSRHGPGGTCQDVPGFAHDLYRTCGHLLSDLRTPLGTLAADGTYQPRANPLADPGIAALSAAHEEFARTVRTALDAHPPDAPEVVLPDEALERATALLPPESGTLPRSYACYLQWAGSTPHTPRAVLNWVHTGLGQPLARFARSFTPRPQTEHAVTEALRARHEELSPPGAVFADLSGGYDTSNVTLRPALAPYRLVGPADTGHGPPSGRLPVEELTLVDDEESGELQLRSARLGKRVVPLWLGGLVPMALPRIQRTLLTLSPASMPMAGDVWQCLDRATVPAHRPRVRCGPLVLTRRSWHFERAGLPPAQPPVDSAHGLLARRRWWKAAGLPTRVMARTDTDTKPQAVDADSPLSLALLDHRLRGCSQAVFTELLPDIDEAALSLDGSSHVSEVCVELDAAPTSPHTDPAPGKEMSR
ncbi:lantibiotic dehydratase [Streptomyces sp. NPDC007083]|uniref:lantibiotic dehydratase n=1 Tax=unclassified Streptomyces TaxID=2593676 RepID=UPI0033DA0765